MHACRASIEPVQANPRYSILDAWRGICASIVVLYHFAPKEGGIAGIPIIANGFLFVDFFFVLSGFVLAHSYQGRLQSRHDLAIFISRRFARLWPLHALILLLFILLELVRAGAGSMMGTVAPAFSGHYPLHTLPTQLLFLEGLGINDQLTWNSPSWSISCEFIVSLTFGLMCISLLPSLILYACGIIIGAGIVAIFILSPVYMDTAHDYGAIRCGVDFCFGAICNHSVKHLGRFQVGKIPSTVLEVISIAAVCLFVAMSGVTVLSLWAPFVFGPAVVVFSFAKGRISKVLTAPIFQAMGAWSYSIYMLQVPVAMAVYYVSRLVAKASPSGISPFSSVPEKTQAGDIFAIGHYMHEFLLNDGTVIIQLMITIALASFSYRRIEVPCQAVLNRWSVQLLAAKGGMAARA